MTPAIITLASLAWLAALCCGFPAPVAGRSATNGFLRITIPADLAYYGGQAVVRAAAYAHERTELVLKHAGALLSGNIAAWTTWSFMGGIIEPVLMFVAFYALAWGLQRSRVAIRLREYVGHAVEVQEVERHKIAELADYRTWEIGWMHTGKRYAGLFGPVSTDEDENAAVRTRIGRRLRRVAPVARLMRRLIERAIRRFAAA